MSVEGCVFQLGYIERVPLGTDFYGIAHHVGRLLARLPRDTDLAIDYTGLGLPVFQIFHHLSIFPTGIVITPGGSATTAPDGTLHVPKADLIGRLQALLHGGQLKIQKDLPAAKVLVEELIDFRARYTAAGNLTFSAREGRHDDLLLALAIACYRAAGDGQRFAGVLEYYRKQLAAAGKGYTAPRHFVGVDLGYAADFTAIAIIRRVEHPSPAEAGNGAFLPNPDEPPRPAPRPIWETGETAKEAHGAGAVSTVAMLYAAPFAAFQVLSGRRYEANEAGEIVCSDPDDAESLRRAGCRVSM